jgi:ribosome-binding ATPase
MKIGLIGLAKSGKTTVFNAITRSDAETGAFTSGKPEPNISVVEVADARVDSLSAMFKPKKTAHATIEFMDFVGIARDEDKKQSFTASELGLIKTSEALAIVLRNFANEMLDAALGSHDPASDLENVISDMVLSDLIIAETRIERIDAQCKKGGKTPALDLERATLVKILSYLNSDKRPDLSAFTAEELKSIRGFQFLTLKPTLIILNSDDISYGKNEKILTGLNSIFPAIEFAGEFEMELCRLSAEEAKLFMDDMGIESSARDRLTQMAYDILGLITFFTVGPDEVRAWTINKGETALDAAGTIHSDLARGFIRAECFTYVEIMEHGSEKHLKEKGLVRLEGKTYVVKDGDILNIRFSV